MCATGLVVNGLLQSEGTVWAGAYVLAPVTAAPLAVRERAPLATLFAVIAGAIACSVALGADWAAIGVGAIALYNVALVGDRVRSLVVGAATAFVIVSAVVVVSGHLNLDGIAKRLPLLAVALVVGDAMRSRRALRVAAHEHDRLVAHEREEDNHRRLTDERLRIARELHDTLAHALVAINVRASVEEHLRSQDPWVALKDIKEASVSALGDLRSTLNLLRDRDGAIPTTPNLGLEGLPELADYVRASGLHADFDVQINGPAVPTPVGQAAFRIVQEALTNVLRHADAATVHVGVRSRVGALHLEIKDDGRADTNSDAGLGLRGMAERASALGGEVKAGPREDGGWGVNAVLPLKGRRAR